MQKNAVLLDRVRESFDAIQTLETDQQVLKACGAGARAIHEMTAKTSVAEVNKVMDDLADAMECQKDVEKAMTQGLAASEEGEGDEAVLQELAQLEEQMNAPAKSMAQAPAAPGTLDSDLSLEFAKKLRFEDDSD
jgi:hypothetical protein